MSRDHEKLRTFSLTDDLAVAVSQRLDFLSILQHAAIDEKCGELLRTLQRLVTLSLPSDDPVVCSP